MELDKEVQAKSTKLRRTTDVHKVLALLWMILFLSFLQRGRFLILFILGHGNIASIFN